MFAKGPNPVSRTFGAFFSHWLVGLWSIWNCVCGATRSKEVRAASAASTSAVYAIACLSACAAEVMPVRSSRGGRLESAGPGPPQEDIRDSRAEETF